MSGAATAKILQTTARILEEEEIWLSTEGIKVELTEELLSDRRLV